MWVRYRQVLLVFALGAVCLWGAASTSWQKKFKDWTERDAQTVMTDSPWAKQIPMPASGRPGVVYIEPGANGAPPPSAALGNPSNTTTGNNMSAAANPGSAGPADPTGTHNFPNAPTASTASGSTGAPEPQAPITIVWASAAPVRLAVLKLRTKTPTDEEIENTTKLRPNYVIAVIGLPAPEGGSDPKALASSAFLSVKGRAPQVANDSTYRRIGNSDVYFFRFTRSSFPIAGTDQQVEFRMTMGKMEIRKRFDLKDMQYEGELAL